MRSSVRDVPRKPLANPHSDRANTDIKFGLEGKLGGTLGVLTGVSTKEEFLEGDTRPAFYVDKLADLFEGS